MSNELDSDQDLFVAVLPVMCAILEHDDYPKQMIYEALHVWTRPRGSNLQLSLEMRASLLSYIRKMGRENSQFDAATTYETTSKIAARGLFFRASYY